MSRDVLGGPAKWPMTNVRNLGVPQWRRLAEQPENRYLIPLTEFCEWTPDVHPKAMITVLELGDHERWLAGSYDVRALRRAYDGGRISP